MTHSAVFTREALDNLFPADRSDQFFDALFGDSTEGSYDIVLEYVNTPQTNTINFELHLKQRPGKCLVCNLTYGLPEVFTRHPILNLAGVVTEIGTLLNHPADKINWKLGSTQSTSNELHTIPLTITLN